MGYCTFLKPGKAQYALFSLGDIMLMYIKHAMLAKSAVYYVFYRYGGAFQNFSVKLPITINKFFQPTEMEGQDFFQRWKQLSG